MSLGRHVSTFQAKGVRPAQEDHILADREKKIFIVADGFGGPVPGSLASKTACDSIRNFLFKQAGDLDATLPFVLRNYFSLVGNVLYNALIHANRKLRKLNENKNVNECGGASVVAAFLDGDLLALANVGTCSARLFREFRSVELVTPRSYGRLVDPFQPASGEAQVPMIALGMADDLEPEIFEYRVEPGDWLLLHSDGISEELCSRLLEVKKDTLNLEVASEKALKILNEFNYTDNASVSLVII